MSQSPYDAMQQLLGPGAAPAEAHGLVSGYLAAHADGDFQGFAEVLALAMPELLGSERGDVALEALFNDCQSTLGSMADGNYTFEPLLPTDSTELGERLAAMAAWANGFLMGLGTGQDFAKAAAALSGDAREALEDIAGIARLDTEQVESDEGDEKDFVEVTEYLKVATMLLYEELVLANRSRPVPGSDQALDDEGFAEGPDDDSVVH